MSILRNGCVAVSNIGVKDHTEGMDGGLISMSHLFFFLNNDLVGPCRLFLKCPMYHVKFKKSPLHSVDIRGLDPSLPLYTPLLTYIQREMAARGGMGRLDLWPSTPKLDRATWLFLKFDSNIDSEIENIVTWHIVISEI